MGNIQTREGKISLPLLPRHTGKGERVVHKKEESISSQKGEKIKLTNIRTMS